jgi:hypothetical protein
MRLDHWPIRSRFIKAPRLGSPTISPSLLSILDDANDGPPIPSTIASVDERPFLTPKPDATAQITWPDVRSPSLTPPPTRQRDNTEESDATSVVDSSRDVSALHGLQDEGPFQSTRPRIPLRVNPLQPKSKAKPKPKIILRFTRPNANTRAKRSKK